MSFYYFHPGKVEVFVEPFYESTFLFTSNSQNICTFDFLLAYNFEILHAIKLLLSILYISLQYVIDLLQCLCDQLIR